MVDPEEVKDLQDHYAAQCDKDAEAAGPSFLLLLFYIFYGCKRVALEEEEEVRCTSQVERWLFVLGLHGVHQEADLDEETQEGKDEINGGHGHLNQEK